MQQPEEAALLNLELGRLLCGRRRKEFCTTKRVLLVRRNSQVDSSSGTNGKIEANATVFRRDWLGGALGNPEEEEKE